MEVLRRHRRGCSITLRWITLHLVVTACGITLSQEPKPNEKPQPKPLQILQEQTTLPKYEDLALPEAEALLRARAFDWIVLKNQDVLVVDAIAIRPDMTSRLVIKQDMATATYNRILKHKPYKDAELASLRLYIKDADKVKEFDAREAQLKQELETARDRPETFKPATYRMPVTLQDGSVDPEYVLELRYVDTIVYFEDLVLRRADRLLEQGKTQLAYDLLLLVARRHRDNNALILAEVEADEKKLLEQINELEKERAALRKARDELNAPKNKTSAPAKMRLTAVEKTIVAIAVEIKDLEDEVRNLRFKMRFVRPKDFPNPDPLRRDDFLFSSWPKFDDVYQRLVIADADRQFENGNIEESLRLLEELWKPGHEIPGLASRIGRAIDKLIAPCLERSDFRQARFFLADLETREPSSPLVQKWRDDLAQRATAALQNARNESSQGNLGAAVRSAELAATIWPQASGLRETHRELSERYPILKVGVTHLAGEQFRTGIPSEADERVRWLTEARLFEPASTTSQGVRYRSSFFDSWEPTDLGRRVQFRLKFKRAEWEARPLVTSADVFAELVSRTTAGSENYDERLAGFVDGISIQSPTDFTVNFRQLPLRPEALWQLTVPIGSETRSLNDGISVGNSSELGRNRFQKVDGPKGQAVYRRVRAEPATVRQRHVEEVAEIKYETWERALQGLMRGETSLLPVAALRDLKGLREDGRFQVIPYALARSHLLLFNPEKKAMLDGQFRRALLHAVPRQRLLNEIVLRDAETLGRLIVCPFPTTSYGYSSQLAPPDYNPTLSAALALTAKKQLGGELPVLKMICPDDAIVREVARAMIAEWKRVGIEAELVEDANDNDWDICYRTAKCVEPLMDVWPLLTLQTSARVDSLQPLSEPTRRLLLELERAVDWTSATKLLHRLSADLLIEARYVPLWELDEFLVARKNINGIPPKLMHAYDDIERWTVQPWYPQETP